MATYQMDLVQKRTRCCNTVDGFPQVFTGEILIPIGTSFNAADIIEVADVAALHTVESARVFTDRLDDATTISWNFGFRQLNPGTGYAGTNASGVAVDYDVASATTFASPATNATYFQTGNTFGRTAGWSSFTMANTTDVSGPGGPVRLTLTQTAATPTQTTASTTARTIRMEFYLAKTAPTAVNVVDRGGY